MKNIHAPIKYQLKDKMSDNFLKLKSLILNHPNTFHAIFNILNANSFICLSWAIFYVNIWLPNPLIYLKLLN